MILSLRHEEQKSQNPLHMKTKTLSLVLIPVLAYLSVSPTSQAVNPPPDGGYPGGNTAEGDNALLNLTSGTYNTAIGWVSISTNNTGSFNTAIGAGTLFANTADANTATGAGALLNNTTGANNTASGVFALFDNTTGGSNTATGLAALGDNTTGSFNTANGANALLTNTTGGNNTAIGYQALQSNTTANGNTATGFQALLNNATGGFNTAIGTTALISNTTGFGNVAVGFQTLQTNTIGGSNTAIGATALQSTTGGGNTAIGNGALFKNSTGDSNTALGISAGSNITTATNVICIGSDGANVNSSCFIGNIRGVTTANTDAIPVLIDSTGQLGTVSSSHRYKTNIQAMDEVSQAILDLKPVIFHYKSDATKAAQFGLIAEEVAEVNPDLVVHDKNGEIYTVRYEVVNAMLLNEFLKEHRKIQEQEATIAQLRKDLQVNVTRQQKQIEALTAGLQEVTAQVELTKSAPQTVLNNW
jgi:Chaperone of endosialidase